MLLLLWSVFVHSINCKSKLLFPHPLCSPPSTPPSAHPSGPEQLLGEGLRHFIHPWPGTQPVSCFMRAKHSHVRTPQCLMVCLQHTLTWRYAHRKIKAPPIFPYPFLPPTYSILLYVLCVGIIRTGCLPNVYLPLFSLALMDCISVIPFTGFPNTSNKWILRPFGYNQTFVDLDSGKS